jgi:hypothetical protein
MGVSACQYSRSFRCKRGTWWRLPNIVTIPVFNRCFLESIGLRESSLWFPGDATPIPEHRTVTPSASPRPGNASVFPKTENRRNEWMALPFTVAQPTHSTAMGSSSTLWTSLCSPPSLFTTLSFHHPLFSPPSLFTTLSLRYDIGLVSMNTQTPSRSQIN